jgi:mercuric reductase
MQYQLGMLRGYVRVNDELQTSVSNIWAAGDLIGNQTDSPPATPVDAHDGVIAAVNALSGERRMVTHRVIPRIIFADLQEVKGVPLITPNAGEVIYEAATAMCCHAKPDDFIDMIHVYPTMAEALKIAAISYFKDPAKLSCCAE